MTTTTTKYLVYMFHLSYLTKRTTLYNVQSKDHIQLKRNLIIKSFMKSLTQWNIHLCITLFKIVPVISSEFISSLSEYWLKIQKQKENCKIKASNKVNSNYLSEVRVLISQKKNHKTMLNHLKFPFRNLKCF